MQSEQQYTTVRVPRELVPGLKAIAVKHHRNLQGEISYVLEKHIEEYRHIIEAAQEES